MPKNTYIGKKMIELCNHIQVSDEHITILGSGKEFHKLIKKFLEIISNTSNPKIIITKMLNFFFFS